MRKQGNALVPFWDVSETKQNHFSGTVNKQFFNLGNFVLVSKSNPQELLKGKTIRNITSGTKQFFFFFLLLLCCCFPLDLVERFAPKQDREVAFVRDHVRAAHRGRLRSGDHASQRRHQARQLLVQHPQLLAIVSLLIVGVFCFFLQYFLGFQYVIVFTRTVR